MCVIYTELRGGGEQIQKDAKGNLYLAPTSTQTTGNDILYKYYIVNVRNISWCL